MDRRRLGLCSEDVDCAGASTEPNCVAITTGRKSCAAVDAPLTPTAGGCTRAALTTSADNAFSVRLGEFL